MTNKMDSAPIYKKLIEASIERKGSTLAHQVEHAGYGAILSRLMTGLNLSLVLKANYFFQINSFYRVEDLFEIDVKQSFEDEIGRAHV